MIDLDNPTGTQVNKDIYEAEKWMWKNPFNFIIGWIGIIAFVSFERFLDLFDRKGGENK